eukprot:TRINITY_DN8338_c0_g1_i1.p1 TRINITY_DN8338_c0_g1~~TRINITY_DN8338_c0_g1_i1.p1  ORF type:complete len:416 (-),score=86.97 TRINITY_DN8338_c0_g1_i1:98-1345(-)
MPRLIYVCVLAVFFGFVTAYTPTPLTPQEQANLNVVMSYFGNIAALNFAQAATYTSPNLQFIWHGPSELVPNAGQFSTIGAFFGKVGANFRNLVFDGASLTFGPVSGGNVLVQFQEGATNINSNKPYNGQQNVVLYRVAGNLITNVDIFIDPMVYAVASCAGMLLCVPNSVPAAAPIMYGNPVFPLPASAVTTGLSARQNSNYQTVLSFITALGQVRAGGSVSLLAPYVMPNVTVRWNGLQSYIPFGGRFLSQPTSSTAGFADFQTALSTYLSADTVTLGPTFPIIGDTQVLVSYLSNGAFRSTGKTFTNVPVITLFTFDTSGLIFYVDTYADTSYYAVAGCSGQLQCVPQQANASTVCPPAEAPILSTGTFFGVSFGSALLAAIIVIISLSCRLTATERRMATSTGGSLGQRML